MKTNNKREINIFSLILKIAYDLLIAVCILFILIIFMQKITENEKTILGFRIFTVISGSMEPKYNIGEVVICKEVDTDNIKIGDTIVYRGNSGQIKGKVIMHDVVKISEDENGNLIFHARGLENNQDDPDIKPEQIYGTCVYESYLLTLLYEVATSTYGSAVIIVVLVLNVFLSFKSKRINSVQFEENENYVDLSKMENSVLYTDEEISEEKKEKIQEKYNSLRIKLAKEQDKIQKIENEIKKRRV